MASTVQIIRSGNLIQVEGLDESQVSQLRETLSYNHRVTYQGAELFARRNQLRANPHARFNPDMEIQRRLLYQMHGDNLVCSAGLRKRLLVKLRSMGVKIKTDDVRVDKLPPANWAKLEELGEIEFRHRQPEALAMIDSCEGGVIVAPTGFGKTFMAAVLCKIYPRSRIAFVSPGIQLMQSTYDKLQKIVPGQVGMLGGGRNEPNKRITLCSADSLHKLPLDKMHLIIYDEVHTSATDKRAALLCGKKTDAKFIGFTASPNCRADGADFVVEAIFGPILLTVTYAEAVDNDAVTPINTQFITLPKDFDLPVLVGEQWQKKRDGYWLNRKRNHVISQAVKHFMGTLDVDEPQTLIMVESVEHAFNLQRYLPDFELMYSNISDTLLPRLESFGFIDSSFKPLDNKQRIAMLRDFEAGKLKRVISTHCWKQGIDPTHLRMFVRADGGTSEVNNIQLPGRLSRVQEGKSEGLLLDMWDEWDPWALNRSRARHRAYERNGFVMVPRVQME